MSTTPNMNLTLPVPSTTLGPQWATQINSAFGVVDQHNHTFGSGVQVPTAGLNINSDLSFNGYSAINLKGSVYADVQGVAPVATGQIYVNNGDLYFLDGSGTAIPITVAGAIAGTPGDISNLLPPAVAAWDVGSASFIFTQNTNQAASFDIGPVTIRRTSVSSFGVTLEPASGIGANYTLTLPSSPPASAQSVLSIATTGAVTNAAPDSTITVTSTQIKVANSGITATQLATGAVTATKMGAATYAVSSSTGNSYAISASATPTAVPALYSVFSAVNTRPMIIMLNNDQSGTSSTMGSTDNWSIYFEVIGPSGTTQVARNYFSANAYSGVAGVCGFYLPAVGVHTIQAYVIRPNPGLIGLTNTKLVVYQL